MSHTYIIDGTRSPLGNFLGGLSTVAAPNIASALIKELLKRNNLRENEIEEVVLGQVLQAGAGQAPARQAALLANLDKSVPCSTINKVCGSGLESVVLSSLRIKLDEVKLSLVGGMENMSQAPYLSKNLRKGFKFGDATLVDSLQFDGLTDAYSNKIMGECAELCATKYGISREEQDQFAENSYRKSIEAQEKGLFKNEITPIDVPSRKKTIRLIDDEGPQTVNFEKMRVLKPAFLKEGTITAANASTLNDGAACLLLGGEEYKNRAKFKIISCARNAVDPEWFTIAPIGSIHSCLEKANLKIEDIDYFEINEAFSVVPLVAQKECLIPDEKINVFGGAVSLGHPLGCSGARILVTLMNVLEQKKGKLGLASICIGGGEALSVIIERID